MRGLRRRTRGRGQTRPDAVTHDLPTRLAVFAEQDLRARALLLHRAAAAAAVKQRCCVTSARLGDGPVTAAGVWQRLARGDALRCCHGKSLGDARSDWIVGSKPGPVHCSAYTVVSYQASCHSRLGGRRGGEGEAQRRRRAT